MQRVLSFDKTAQPAQHPHPHSSLFLQGGAMARQWTCTCAPLHCACCSTAHKDNNDLFCHDLSCNIVKPHAQLSAFCVGFLDVYDP